MTQWLTCHQDLAGPRAARLSMLSMAARCRACGAARSPRRRQAGNGIHDRRGHQGGLLVSVGSLPGLPNNQRRRLAHARSSRRRGGDKSHSLAVVPLMPAKCAVRGASCAYQGRASQTKCVRSIAGECLANDCNRPRRREAAGGQFNILILSAAQSSGLTFDKLTKSTN